MRPSRERLAANVAAKISADWQAKSVVRRILRSSAFSHKVRYVAAGIVLLESELRPTTWRLVEYLYVLLRLPGYRTVTVGAAQIRYEQIAKATKACRCGAVARTPTWHIYSEEHQAARLLDTVRQLATESTHWTQVVNVFNKGPRSDTSLDTVYSRVVLRVAEALAQVGACDGVVKDHPSRVGLTPGAHH